MNFVSRVWKALVFAARALAHCWHHGDKATLTLADAPLAPPTIDEFVAAVEGLVGRERVVLPFLNSGEELSVVVAESGPNTRCTSDAAFCVLSGWVNADIAYEGDKGARARDEIEKLRDGDVEWAAYRSGQLWDWGPRRTS